MPATPGPLGSVRILDFTTMMSGPMATRLFADLGADVVKVERPPGGDHNRGRTPVYGGSSRFFTQLNAGKRSVTLDLAMPPEAEFAQSLARRADVVIENNRPGVMAKLGLGYAAVHEGNPGVVYCSISGYGQDTSAATRAAYAPNIHAASGYDLANLRYQDDPAKPANTAIFLADALAAIYACTAIQAALLARHSTGEGQFIDLALFDVMLNLMVFEMQAAQTSARPPRSVYVPLATTDGFVSVAPVSQLMFVGLTRALGRPDLAEDERFRTAPARELHWTELMDILGEWAAVRTSAECLGTLLAAGVAAAPFRTPEEVMTDPYLAERGILSAQSDAGGAYYIFNPPYTFADRSVHARGPAPALGADRDSVTADWLGGGRG
ncbi:CoA transferase [Frankia sp. Cas3]|uniref:CaiB/BaiF CoA transferase family protein n=1 Tax=Frankia sp. Cas3 TaxID=3073926 RepID=UPI002AD4A453|nr:CoA transferase [Frankia sp. Cas3]